MATQPSQLRTSTILAVVAGTAVAGFVGYAVYFDYKRRSDPEFRRALKRESRRQAKAAQADAVAQAQQQKKQIREAVDKALEEGFPTEQDELESYFMQEVAKGETMCQDGSDSIEAALCFYKALKVYPQPRDLINIYDKTVPKVRCLLLQLFCAVVNLLVWCNLG